MLYKFYQFSNKIQLFHQQFRTFIFQNSYLYHLASFYDNNLVSQCCDSFLISHRILHFLEHNACIILLVCMLKSFAEFLRIKYLIMFIFTLLNQFATRLYDQQFHPFLIFQFVDFSQFTFFLGSYYQRFSFSFYHLRDHAYFFFSMYNLFYLMYLFEFF